MPQRSELRVFISSTFQDLQEEREHLIKEIFPEIRALCRERGITFTEVDLRWGLTDEDVALGRVIRTCLEEVDKCRPYFIGITGDRYGFIPTRNDLDKDPTLLQKYPWLEGAVMERMSITEMEACAGVLRGDGGVRSENAGAPMIRQRGGEDESGGRSNVGATRDAPVSGHLSARFYFRRHQAGLDAAAEIDPERTRLAAYQERIRAAGASIAEFNDPNSLGELIRDDLIAIISRDFADARPLTPLEEERMRHAAFSLSRRRAYIPDPVCLKRLNDHAASVDPPLVVYAESGSGKSSLFAFWAEQYRRENPGAHVIEHYVGIGATSTDHYAVIRHVCMEIKERFNRDEQVPTDATMLEQALGEWIGYADHELKKRSESMVLILDGLNQLKGDALGLKWIPDLVFPSIRMILSSTVEGTLVELRSRGWGEFGMQAITEEQRKAVVVRYLSEYGKSLNPQQIARIARDYKCGHPLFLKTLLEELRVVGRHEELEQRIGEYLATSGTEDLFQRVLQRIEEDHGASSVRTVMVTVWGSRSGLDEQELSEATALSRLKVASMTAGLEYHLVRKDGRLTFFHDYLRRAVQKRYLADSARLTTMRYDLAHYFESLPLTERTALELLSQYGPDDDAEPTPEQDEKLAATLARGDVLLLLFRGATSFEILARWTKLSLRGRHADVYYRRTILDHDAAQSDTHGRLLSLAGSVLGKLGHLEAAWDLHNELLTWASHHNRRDDEVQAHLGLGRILQTRGESAASIPHFDQSLRLADELGDTNGTAESLGNIAQALISLGRHSEAMEHVERLLVLCRQVGDRPRMAQAIGKLGALREKQGKFAEALECLEQQLAMHHEMGDLRGASRVSNDLGAVYARMSRYSDAMECFGRMRALCDEIGDRRGAANALNNMGLVYTMLAQYQNASDCYRRLLALGERLGYRRSMREAITGLGNVSLQRCSYVDALVYYERGLALCMELDERAAEATVRANMGIAHFHLGRYKEALDCHGQALAIDDDTGNRNASLIAIGNMGDVHCARGDYDRALQAYATASAGHRDIGFRYGLTYWLAGTAAVLLAISALDEMPEYLPDYLPELTGDAYRIGMHWRALGIHTARMCAEECIDISDAISKQDTRFGARILLARVEAAEGQHDAARHRLNDMLEHSTSDEERADIYYWLWKFGLRDHGAQARALYDSLYAATSRRDYYIRIEELKTSEEHA